MASCFNRACFVCVSVCVWFSYSENHYKIFTKKNILAGTLWVEKNQLNWEYLTCLSAHSGWHNDDIWLVIYGSDKFNTAYDLIVCLLKTVVRTVVNKNPRENA